MIYREKSETRLMVETFLRDFKEQTGGEIETMDPDSKEGAGFCRAYDIVEYPTLIAIGPEGVQMAKWRGTMPTISDASAYK